MSTIYNYDEFLLFVAREHKQLSAEDSTIRYGQTYFNCLWEFRPSIASEIRATEMDPFHKSEVSPLTHVHVQGLWEEMNARVMKSIEES
jgi:hypothetical protein